MRTRTAFFFFQAEDGIRDYKVTGVQTCALPICRGYRFIGQIAEGRQPPAKEQEIAGDNAIPTLRHRDRYLPLGLVGRDEALARMRSRLEKMLGGERQIV